MNQLAEGGWITVIGITVVFAILAILAIIMYAIGAFERGMTGGVKKVEETEEKPEEIPPEDLAIITASILAYRGRRRGITRKVSDAWRLYGLQTGMNEVENFNYEIRKW